VEHRMKAKWHWVSVRVKGCLVPLL
jgi:hypothetical protein